MTKAKNTPPDPTTPVEGDDAVSKALEELNALKDLKDEAEAELAEEEATLALAKAILGDALLHTLNDKDPKH